MLLRSLKESGAAGVGVGDGAELRCEAQSWHKMRTPFKNIWVRAAASLLLLCTQKTRQRVGNMDKFQEITS